MGMNRIATTLTAFGIVLGLVGCSDTPGPSVSEYAPICNYLATGRRCGSERYLALPHQNAPVVATETSHLDRRAAESWSNGQTGGQINRLKTLKRVTYGRAGIGLLRARMLLLPATYANRN
jgi:hypothetical protein